MNSSRRTVQEDKLRVLREDAGYTIAGLARAMGVGSVSYLSQVQRELIQPGPAYLRRIADTLAKGLGRPVSLDEFSTREPIDRAA